MSYIERSLIPTVKNADLQLCELGGCYKRSTRAGQKLPSKSFTWPLQPMERGCYLKQVATLSRSAAQKRERHTPTHAANT